MRARRKVTDASILDVKLGPVAIAERGPAHHGDLALIIDLAHPAQLFAQDLCLARDLKLIGSVLIMAAAAPCEQRTRGRHTFRRGHHHFHQTGVNVLVHFDAGGFTRQNEGRQHHTPIQARQSVAPVYPLFNLNFV